MKTLLLGLGCLAGVLLLTGCASSYNVTLSSGTTVTAKSRPKLDENGYYHFRDANGKEVMLPRVRVRAIEVR
jgi:hypothetical protein